MSAYNLKSPNAITCRPAIDSLSDWLQREYKACALSEHESVVLDEIVSHLDEFVRWPSKPLLLWDGCTRKDKYHTYPEVIKKLARSSGVHLDTRANGPAITAFLLAGGERPRRYGSTNSWSIHHLYSGKFPVEQASEVMWAARHQSHMTQAAGLVAIHPIADQACDEYPFFAWYLRAQAYRRFAYDPSGVFSDAIDSLGFTVGTPACEVVYRDSHV